MYTRRWEWRSALELLLPPLLLTGIAGSSQKIVSISGSNVTLQSTSKLPNNSSLGTWFYTANQKVVEWDSSGANYFNTRFSHRVKLKLDPPALHIYNTQKEDSSTYLLRLSNEDGSEYETSIILEVLDPVPNFTIQIGTTKVGDNCYMNLSCDIPDQSVEYIWYKDSGPFPNESHKSVLEVNLTSSQEQSKFYTCEISNAVSRKNDTVYFHPPCNLVRSSGVIPNKESSRPADPAFISNHDLNPAQSFNYMG